MTATVALVLLALVPGRAGAVALPSETDPWILIQTKHFVIYSNASERRTLDLGRRLERFRASLSRFNTRLKVDPPVTTSLYVFKDDASLTPYKVRFNGRPVQLSGLFIGHPDGYYMLVNSARQGDPLDVIYHEYTHHFLNNNLHKVPPWFGEGLAECYSTFRADEKTASIGLTQSDHVRFLREHDLIPLRELFSITAESADYNEGERRGVFYAESWALMHYLLWDRPERKPQFLGFLERLSRGEDPGSAFPASFQASYETIENELRNYVRQARFLYTAFKISDLKIDDAVQVVTLKREETLYRLGDLLLHVDPDRVAEAEELFREALRINPEYATAHAGLAHAAALSERYEEAVTLFERALKGDPGDPMTCFHFAQCLVGRARKSSPAGSERGAWPDLERAVQLFGKAIEMRPGFAEAYVEYARVLMEQGGPPGPAIHLLETARPMFPSRIDIIINLATLHARKGDNASARDLVENVLARMGDREALEQARHRIRMEQDHFATMQAAAARQEAADVVSEADEGLPDLPDSSSDDNTVAVYNQAVARANQRDYDGAIALLENLLKHVQSEDLRAQITTLLGRLKTDAARLRKSHH